MIKKRKRPSLKVLAPLGLLFATLFLCGCGGKGYSGGIVFGIFHEGIWEECGSNYSSASSEGKRTTIDGVEIALPVDWSYAISKQPDFCGNNWNGDDAYRGIGIFNCNEEGDPTDKDKQAQYQSSYAVSFRYEYCSYGYRSAPEFKTHESYHATSVSMPDMKVAGTSDSCTTSDGSRIIDQKNVDNLGAYVNALRKAKIIVVNPKNNKACVCAPGWNAVKESDNKDQNWGGHVLDTLGGITPAVSAAITDSGTWEEIQPHAGDDNVALELYFTDPDAELGPCEFNGATATGSVGSGNKCLNRSGNVKASSIADLAVSCAYDGTNEQTQKFNGHEMISYVSGDDKAEHPSTSLARELRKLAVNNEDEVTADCGKFVASVVRCTVDKEFPKGDTNEIKKYCEESSKWKKVDMTTPTIADSQKEFEPGDVLVFPKNECSGGRIGHTEIYVGKDAILQQFGENKAEGGYLKDTSNFKIVTASHNQFGPKLIPTSWEDRPYYIYRFIGTPDPLVTEEQIKNLVS